MAQQLLHNVLGYVWNILLLSWVWFWPAYGEVFCESDRGREDGDREGGDRDSGGGEEGWSRVVSSGQGMVSDTVNIQPTDTVSTHHQ